MLFLVLSELYAIPIVMCTKITILFGVGMYIIYITDIFLTYQYCGCIYRFNILLCLGTVYIFCINVV